MSTSKIEWTQATLNPAVGCSKISPACDHCYALRMANRLAANPAMRGRYAGVVKNGRWTGQINLCPEVMLEAVKRRKPTLYFVGSMTDLFHKNVPDSFLDKVFTCMEKANRHTFQLLTKRETRLLEYMARRRDKGLPLLQNVVAGVTVENQETADRRLPILMETAAAHRFVSIEPMLGPIVLQPEHGLFAGPGEALDWVICGGETGPGARPMHPAWVRKVQDHCAQAATPFFFKQWGDWHPHGQLMKDGSVNALGGPDDAKWHNFGDGESAYRVTKKKAGRFLDGRAYDEYPAW